MRTLEQIIKTNKNAAMKSVKGLTGYERAVAVKEHFDELGHPHARWTFDKLYAERTNDKDFARKLFNEMLYLVSENQFISQ